jgi:hypothetical protein
LDVEFGQNVLDTLKAQAAKEAEKTRAEIERKKAEALDNLMQWEAGTDRLNSYTVHWLALNTVVRVVGDVLETSKGMKVPLNQAIRVFKLWEAGKAMGASINIDGHAWTCSKANGAITFGCHVIDFDQAKRVLTPYL